LTLLTSDDGGALIRLIAGDLAGHAGPGVTHTPITYAHVTLPPGGRLVVPWNPVFNAMAYALLGQGYADDEERPFREHELVRFVPSKAAKSGSNVSAGSGPAGKATAAAGTSGATGAGAGAGTASGGPAAAGSTAGGPGGTAAGAPPGAEAGGDTSHCVGDREFD